MQEFSSVTASAYDADALTPLLSEKAAEGWEVLSIVSAGTNIVAYLQRGDGAAAAAPVAEVAPVVADEPVAEAPADDVADTADDSAPDPVDEPSGWAQAPDDTGEAAADTASDVAAGAAGAAAAATSEPTVPAADPVVDVAPEPTPEPVVTEQPAAEPAAAEPAAATAPQEESTVPAGWYADPSGRYELRYWDGSAWTEHVSRAGQQFTDPPVA